MTADERNTMDSPIRNNVLDPQGLTKTQVSLLIQNKQGWSEKQRQAAFPKKKQLRLPPPRTKAKRGQSTYLFNVSKHLNAVGMRMLNESRVMTLDRDARTHRVPFAALYASLPAAQLSDRLLGYVEAKAGDRIVFDYYEPVQPGDGFYRLPHSKLVEVCDEVAEKVREAWDPTFVEKLSAAGRKGGRISKRPKVFTAEMLDGIDHLSKQQQATKLGCSTTVVARLRKERNEAVRDKPQA